MGTPTHGQHLHDHPLEAVTPHGRAVDKRRVLGPTPANTEDLKRPRPSAASRRLAAAKVAVFSDRQTLMDESSVWARRRAERGVDTCQTPRDTA